MSATVGKFHLLKVAISERQIVEFFCTSSMQPSSILLVFVVVIVSIIWCNIVGATIFINKLANFSSLSNNFHAFCIFFFNSPGAQL